MACLDNTSSDVTGMTLASDFAASLSRLGPLCCNGTNANPHICKKGVPTVDRFQPLDPNYQAFPYVSAVLGSVGIILNLLTVLVLLKQKGMFR